MARASVYLPAAGKPIRCRITASSPTRAAYCRRGGTLLGGSRGIIRGVTRWDEAAGWYLGMVGDHHRGFNHLAADTAMDLLGVSHTRNVVDVGCGEGSFARRLAAGGATVHACDPTATLLAAACTAERDQPLGIRYTNDSAEHLRSVSDGWADAVVALLVLHHVADLAAAFAEAHRVLRPGGILVVVLPHPWTDHGGARWHAGTDGRPRRQLGSYTTEGHWHTDETDSVRSIGWHHRTMATWLTACATAGFVLDELREPVGAAPERADSGGHWQHTPRLLAWRARRPSVGLPYDDGTSP